MLCFANVPRPRCGLLLDFATQSTPSSRLRRLLVCMQEYKHRWRQEGWVSDVVRSRRSTKCGGHERSRSPGHLGLSARPLETDVLEYNA
jgi:hypothetical protein